MLHEGKAQNMWSLAIILLGTVMAVALTYTLNIPMSDMVGILSGATTNTPALGAAQQALEHIGVNSGRAALATAVTYPLGVVGVIFAMILLRKFFVKSSDLELKGTEEEDHTYVGQYVVVNPAIIGKTIAEVSQGSHIKFIISRILARRRSILPQGGYSVRKSR